MREALRGALLSVLFIATGAVAQEQPSAVFQGFIAEAEPTAGSGENRATTVLSRRLSDDGDTLYLEVRNEHWKPITAWAISVVESEGDLGRTSVLAEDHYVGLLPGVADGPTPLQPGAVKVIPIQLGRPYAAERFTLGQYDVVTATVEAVVFDDGTFWGRNLRPIESLLRNRYARALRTGRPLGATKRGTVDTVPCGVRRRELGSG